MQVQYMHEYMYCRVVNYVGFQISNPIASLLFLAALNVKILFEISKLLSCTINNNRQTLYLSALTYEPIWAMIVMSAF